MNFGFFLIILDNFSRYYEHKNGMTWQKFSMMTRTNLFDDDDEMIMQFIIIIIRHHHLIDDDDKLEIVKDNKSILKSRSEYDIDWINQINNNNDDYDGRRYLQVIKPNEWTENFDNHHDDNNKNLFIQMNPLVTW